MYGAPNNWRGGARKELSKYCPLRSLFLLCFILNFLPSIRFLYLSFSHRCAPWYPCLEISLSTLLLLSHGNREWTRSGMAFSMDKYVQSESDHLRRWFFDQWNPPSVNNNTNSFHPQPCCLCRTRTVSEVDPGMNGFFHAWMIFPWITKCAVVEAACHISSQVFRSMESSIRGE